MQACVFTEYSGPLTIQSIPKPTPSPNDLFIRVHACALNSADVHIYRASPWPIRLVFGLFRPSLSVLGGSIAGTVHQIGSNVKNFSIGDHIVCDTSPRFGGFAEYCLVNSSMAVKIPSGLSMTHAACYGISTTTVIHGFNLVNLKPPQSILVIGASGGVGSYAVQLAHHIGCTVTAHISHHKHDMFNHLVTNTKNPVTLVTDIPSSGHLFDVIFDAAGYSPAKSFIPILASPGTYIFVGGSDKETLNINMSGSWIGNKNQHFISFMAVSNKENMEKAVSYGIKPIVSHKFGLCEVGDAINVLEQRKVKGKIVIEIVKE